MRSYILCIAASASLQASCGQSDGQAHSQNVACEIVTDYVERFVNEAEGFRADIADAPQNIAVRTAPYEFLAITTKDGPIEAKLPDAIPALADWHSIKKLSEQSVLDACADLDSWASKRAVITDDARIDYLTRGEEWEANVLSIAMPVFTNDGREAVVFASKMAGGLAGVGVVAFYSKREDGKWQLIGEETRWVS